MQHLKGEEESNGAAIKDAALFQYEYPPDMSHCIAGRKNKSYMGNQKCRGYSMGESIL